MGLASLSDLPPIEEFMPPVETAHAIVDEMLQSISDISEGA